MPLKGKTFLGIWHDIKPEGERDYHNWHTREHMPERLGIPGFLRGRRGVAWKRDRQRYLTVYEGETFDVFGSPEYLQRLNNPTPWTQRVQPAFLNFIRCACETVLSRGEGVGGAMATFRAPPEAISEAALRAAAPAIADELIKLHGVSAVHIGIARPEISGAKTKETELRHSVPDGVFGATILVDGIGVAELEAVEPEIVAILAKHGIAIPPADAAVYDIAFTLDSLL